MDVRMPDGTLITNVPDNITQADLMARVERGRAESGPKLKIGQEGFGDALRSTLKDAGWAGRNLAGAGTALSNLWEGAKQVVGKGDDQAIQANRIMAQEAPVGALAGNVALLAPTALIPGANTVAGAGVVGAAQGLLQPTQGDESRAANTALGGAFGAGGQALGNKLGTMLTNRLATQEAKGVADQSRNAVRDATLKSAQDAGYIVPPSTVNPSWLNKRMESLAGKAAVGQEAATKNQDVTNALVRKGIGLADDAPISESAVKQVRTVASQPYKEVAALNKDAAEALEALKQARFETNAQYKFYKAVPNPEVLKKAESAAAEAHGWEKFLEAEAAAAGKPDLVNALRKARQEIAKTHDVERALNTSTGNVVATDLGKMIDKGKPLTGELETAARFADAFPQLAREGSKIPTPGVSKSEALAAALLATGGAAAGGPFGAVAGALPLLSGPARSIVLSKAYQNAMAQPKYGPGITTKALGQVTPERAALLARALAPALAPTLATQ